jgi:hypothetical protein
VDQPFDRPVVQVAVADPDAGRGEGRVVHDFDLVVMGADGHPSGGRLDDPVVAPVVTDGEAPGRCAGRQAEQLVAKANAQDGRSARRGGGEQVGDGCDLRRHGGWVTGSRREDDEVRLVRRHRSGRRVRGKAHDLGPRTVRAARSERFTP